MPRNHPYCIVLVCVILFKGEMEMFLPPVLRPILFKLYFFSIGKRFDFAFLPVNANFTHLEICNSLLYPSANALCGCKIGLHSNTSNIIHFLNFSITASSQLMVSWHCIPPR